MWNCLWRYILYNHFQMFQKWKNLTSNIIPSSELIENRNFAVSLVNHQESKLLPQGDSSVTVGVWRGFVILRLNLFWYEVIDIFPIHLSVSRIFYFVTKCCMNLFTFCVQSHMFCIRSWIFGKVSILKTDFDL